MFAIPIGCFRRGTGNAAGLPYQQNAGAITAWEMGQASRIPSRGSGGGCFFRHGAPFCTISDAFRALLTGWNPTQIEKQITLGQYCNILFEKMQINARIFRFSGTIIYPKLQKNTLFTYVFGALYIMKILGAFLPVLPCFEKMPICL